KGLELPSAGSPGLEKNILARSRAHASAHELEEERRLCFVGITRAREHLHMTAAKYRTVRGISERTIASRFLEELGSEHVHMTDRSDSLGGYGSSAGTGESWEDSANQFPQTRSISSSARQSQRADEGSQMAAGLR